MEQFWEELQVFLWLGALQVGIEILLQILIVLEKVCKNEDKLQEISFNLGFQKRVALW